MNLPHNLGMILLAIWVIAMGLVQAFTLGFTNMNIILGIVAIAAGILVLLGK
jgi:hypothetical protein